MHATRRHSVRIAGTAILALITYFATAILAYALGLSLLRNGIAVDIPWITSIQRNLYHGGLRAVWQNDPDCVAYDPELTYRAKEGRCRFRNAEFDTTMTFAGRTRVHGDGPPDRPGVAFLGDSHGMGWGVGDGETAAAVLQSRLGRTVHNLGVSSYGTARELLALDRSGLLASVDTVVIQYSDNDKDENIGFQVARDRSAVAAYNQITQRPRPTLREQAPFLLAGMRYALKVPFAAIKDWWRGPRTIDFSPHYLPLVERLRELPALATKRVIVFYVNGHGTKFRNFPLGRDPRLPHVEFIDLEIGREHFYLLDDHMTAGGHRYVAERLAERIGR